MNIKVGSIFPENSIYLYNDGIMKKTITTSLFSKKKVIVIGMPGAFTPTCSEKHVPGYVENFEKLT